MWWARRLRSFLILLALSLVLAIAPGRGLLAEKNETIWVIPVEGTIDLGLASFVVRQVAEAERAGAALIVVELSTFGGRVDAATEISDALLRTETATAAFVRDRAWSAGALIALSADTIWMVPGSSIGGAEPRPADEKTISALRAQFQSIAERTDRDPRIAGAMVDKNVQVDDLSEKGDILTLTARQAVRATYAEDIVTEVGDIPASLGIGEHRVVVAQPNWAERAARFLTAPLVSEILLSLALLGLIAEVTTPGFGVPGIAGITSLMLFFGGRFVVGIVGWEVVLLFLLGLALLLTELFVIPGFGVVGLLGIASLLGSFFLSFGGIDAALKSVGLVTLMTLIGTFVLWRIGRRRHLWSRLILSQTSPVAEEDEDGAPASLQIPVGTEGYTLTVLRPVGVVIIDRERFDAVSEGGYIPAKRKVVVKQLRGSRVVVRDVDETGPPL